MSEKHPPIDARNLSMDYVRDADRIVQRLSETARFDTTRCCNIVIVDVSLRGAIFKIEKTKMTIPTRFTQSTLICHLITTCASMNISTRTRRYTFCSTAPA